jgi:hypothetical protein
MKNRKIEMAVNFSSGLFSVWVSLNRTDGQLARNLLRAPLQLQQ